MRHTVRAFDEDLEALRVRVLLLGERALDQLAAGVDCLLRRDEALARRVVSEDAAVDELKRDTDRLVAAVITRQHAVAQDLREILAAGRIASHLERCGDYAMNTARRSLELAGEVPAGVAANVDWMGQRAQRMLRAVLQAYQQRDVAQADLAWASDDELDGLYQTLLEAIVRAMRQDPALVEDGVQLLLIAKGLERYGDHATDIAEEVHLMVTGTPFNGARRAIGDPP